MSFQNPGLLKRIYLVAIVISFLSVYVEWGKESEFIFQMQFDIFFRSGSTFNVLMVPVVFIPFLGQLLLLFNVFRNSIGKKSVLAGIIFCSLPVVLVFIGGISVHKSKMLLSTLPFFVFSFLYFRSSRTKTT